MRRACIAIAVLTAASQVHADVRLHGTLRDRTTGELLLGATVVASPEPANGLATQAAITDEKGAYAIDLVPGKYQVIAYYADHATVLGETVLLGDLPSHGLGERSIDVKNTGCILLLIHRPGPELTGRPYFGLMTTYRGAPLSRDRTHRAWIAPATAADPRTSVTTVEHGVRLHGAPGIPTMFLEEVSTATLRSPIARAAGSGGSTEVTLRAGNNETYGETRSVLALDHTWERTETGFAQESLLAGPIAKDKAWAALGFVVDAERHTSGMARLHAMPNTDNTAELSALVQDTGGARDTWAKAGWTAKTNDRRVELRATATAEQLAQLPDTVAHGMDPSPTGPTLVNRAGAALDLTARVKALGAHGFALHASAGTGAIDDERHRDVALAAGDLWEVRPNVAIEAGVRSDARGVGKARTSVVSPRMALTYDATKEGRSELFIAYQRVPHLDDGFIGAWRGAATPFHDEVSGGVSYSPQARDSVMAGVAVRGQRDEATGDRAGVDGWLRIDNRGGTLLHATASTLNRAAAVFAQRRIGWCESCRDARGLTAMAALRTQQTAALRIHESALGLRWHRPGKGAQPAASIEVYDGTLGSGARLVMGGAF